MDVDWVGVLQAVRLICGTFFGVPQGSQEYQKGKFPKGRAKSGDPQSYLRVRFPKVFSILKMKTEYKISGFGLGKGRMKKNEGPAFEFKLSN